MSQLKFRGILLVIPDDVSRLVSIAERIAEIEPGAVPLKPNNIHVTLIHPSHLKPYRSVLKPIKSDVTALGVLGSAPEPQFPGLVYRVERPERISWIMPVVNQDEMQTYVNNFMAALGGPVNPEQRLYHVSLCNLTGNGSDSVGDVNRADVKSMAFVNLNDPPSQGYTII